jgi:hypothetical protein
MKPHPLPLPLLLAIAGSLAPISARADVIYAAQYGYADHSQILRFSSDGDGAAFMTNGLASGAKGLALDNLGNLYVAAYFANEINGDLLTSKIYKFTPRGTQSVFFYNTNLLEDPQGLAFDSAGNLYAASASLYNSIVKITPGGVGSVLAAGNPPLRVPLGLAFDPEGNLYAANAYNQIAKFTPEGAGSVFAADDLRAAVGTNYLCYPVGIAFDPAGNLFVANEGGSTSDTNYAGTITKFTPDGTGSVFASGLNGPTGVAFDSAGNLYVTSNGQIWKFTRDGVGSVFVPAVDGSYYIAIQPSLVTSVSATPQRVRDGDEIQVVVTAVNVDSFTMNNVHLTTAGVTVSPPSPPARRGGVSLLAKLDPRSVPTLATGRSASFTNIYLATNYGTVSFKAATVGTGLYGLVQGSTNTSSPVKIAPRADLLIRRGVESDALYAGRDVFQTVPAPPQIKTNVVALLEESAFRVVITNEDQRSLTLTLLAMESSSTNWQTSYRLNGSDVTASVKAPGGAILPQLQPGSFFNLDVSMIPTNGASGDRQRVDLSLGVADDPTLTSDAVEAVSQLAREIIVNSTGDLPNQDPNGCCCDTGRKLADGKTPECTLRAAIDLANRLQGKPIIKFQIPGDDPGVVGGVPSIRPQSALPDLSSAMVLDGWSQSPGASRPPIELSGAALTPRFGGVAIDNGEPNPQNLLPAGLANGLHVVSNGCEIRGLVVNSFPLCGILVDGWNTILQGNYFGTDASGALSEPSGYPVGFDSRTMSIKGWHWMYGADGAQVCVRSPGNAIGGTGPHEGNVISGGPNFLESGGANALYWVGTPGLVFLGSGASGNVVEGNIIGLDASASHVPTFPPGPPSFGDTVQGGQYAGVWISDGWGNRIGGATAAAANIIAGNYIGVWVSGIAWSNVIAGNRIGWSANYRLGGHRLYFKGVVVAGHARQNTIGGGPGAGNIIAGIEEGISDGGDSELLQGNWIGISPDGRTAPETGYGIIAAGQSPQIVRNVLANLRLDGIYLSGAPAGRVFLNQIHACGDHGMEVGGACPGTVISSNAITSTRGVFQTDGDGIYIAKDLNESGAVTISQNSIFGNFGLGISFNWGSKPSNVYGSPNYVRLADYPKPVLTNGQLRVQGEFTGSPNATYILEFFVSDHANPSGFGEGQTFIGSAALTTRPTTNGASRVLAQFDRSLPAQLGPGKYLTATVTAPDGTTSEFSKAVLIQPCDNPPPKGVCAGLEQQVPNLSTPPTGGVHPMDLGTGDGNGDGIPDYLEPHVASLPSIAGVWVTLSAPKGTTLENVMPSGPPDFTSLPAGYTFPLGFLSFGITNLPADGVVVMTNFLHLDAAPDFSYAAATFFNYGPTPDNTTSHWYEFKFDGNTGAELLPDRIILHLRDGARGDHDLTVNGEIVTVGAPAYQIPPGPALSVSVAAVGSTNVIDFTTDTNGALVLTTNLVSVATCVLSWPASATNYVLEFTDTLSPVELVFDSTNAIPLGINWQPVLVAPTVVNGQNVVTNTVTGATGFYRLDYVPPVVAVMPAAPPLSIQLTRTNTLLLSWSADSAGFVLQQTSALGTANWVNVTNAVNSVNGQNQVLVAPLNRESFFRLRGL